MKKIIYIIIISMVILSGCSDKNREELIKEVKEVSCEQAGISFTLNGLWEVGEVEEKENTKIELSATHSETGTRIVVMHKNIENEMGDSILRLEDYVEVVKENLKISEDYTYAVGESTSTILYGKEYITFPANMEELKARQQFYLKKNENTITIIIISLYEEDVLKDILALGKKIK